MDILKSSADSLVNCINAVEDDDDDVWHVKLSVHATTAASHHVPFDAWSVATAARRNDQLSEEWDKVCLLSYANGAAEEHTACLWRKENLIHLRILFPPNLHLLSISIDHPQSALLRVFYLSLPTLLSAHTEDKLNAISYFILPAMSTSWSTWYWSIELPHVLWE